MNKDTRFHIIKNTTTNEFFFDFKSSQLQEGFIIVETDLSQEEAEEKTAILVESSGQKPMVNLWD